jgi:hypothetical protein
MSKRVTVQIKVPVFLLEQLQAFAEREMTSLSAVGRKAIALGLASMDRAAEQDARAPHVDR